MCVPEIAYWWLRRYKEPKFADDTEMGLQVSAIERLRPIVSHQEYPWHCEQARLCLRRLRDLSGELEIRM